MARVGLLGGTFNPPHLAHLVCAQEALVQLGLDRVLLVPAAMPPHKAIEAEPGRGAPRGDVRGRGRGGDPRLRRLACSTSSAPGRRTRSTCCARCARGPARRADVHRRRRHGRTRCPTWREPEAVLALARARRRRARGRAPRATSSSASPGWPAPPSASASSTCRGSTSPARCIRRRAAAGLPVRYLVPDAVAELHRARAAVPSARRRLSLGGTA